MRRFEILFSEGIRGFKRLLLGLCWVAVRMLIGTCPTFELMLCFGQYPHPPNVEVWVLFHFVAPD